MIRRIDALLASGGDVLLFRQRELYHMTALANRYTKAPVRFVSGLSQVIRAFEDLYGDLEGSHLETLGRLFAQNVRIYAYPMTAGELREWLNSVSTTGWEWNETNGGFCRPNCGVLPLWDTCTPIFSPATFSSHAVPSARGADA